VKGLIAPWEPVVLLLGRLLLAAIFLHEGVAKLQAYEAAVAYAQAFGVPGRLLPLAIVAELGGGLLIALGYWTRAAAFVLAGFCVATAVIFHTKAGQLLHFEKNLAMAGGFLALMVAGPGRLSLEGWLGHR
jgi:putative oxidoreductase